MGSLEIIKKLDQEIEAPADFTSPEKLYQELIAGIRKYHPSDDITMVEKAYDIAYNAHKEQKRRSGEPYIIHPLCVAIILADLELDKETIVAGNLQACWGDRGKCSFSKPPTPQNEGDLLVLHLVLKKKTSS